MNKRQHFERWLKIVKPGYAPNYNEFDDFYRSDAIDLAYRAWQASPKTRPTESGRVTKERLSELKADTSNIVDHLRGIYEGAASAYPVTPLQLKAADEIEKLRKAAEDMVSFWDSGEDDQSDEFIENLRAALGRKL